MNKSFHSVKTIQKDIFNDKFARFNMDISELLVIVFTLRRLHKIEWYPESAEHSRIYKLQLSLVNSINDRMLDVGCGLGVSFMYYLDLIKEVVGIDFSRSAISRAGKTMKSIKTDTKIILKTMDLFDLDTSRKFDIVVLQTVLEHFRDTDEAGKALRKLSKSMTRGGRIFIYTVNRHFIIRDFIRIVIPTLKKRLLNEMGHEHELFYTGSEINELLEKAGFSNVRCRYFYTPLLFFIELYIYPRLLTVFLSMYGDSKKVFIYKVLFIVIYKPIVFVAQILDMPFLWLKNSSAVVTTAVNRQ